MKLTIIGSGKMAYALIRGLCKSKDVEVVARNKDALKKLKEEFNNIETTKLGDSYDMSGKNIILCTKPYVLPDVSKKLNGEANMLISILAGTKIETLKDNIKAQSYIRVMPNLSASYLKSMTTITGDIDKKDISCEIFNSIGKTLWLSSEKELDIATAIAGSGPAYLALVAEALADGGVNEGLKRADAQQIVNGLFYGFSDLLEDSPSPAIVKDGVMSPAGTTSAGYKALEDGNVRNSFMNAIRDANDRAKEIAGK
jgi:pyrroline-5-carboxylate reductase